MAEEKQTRAAGLVSLAKNILMMERGGGLACRLFEPIVLRMWADQAREALGEWGDDPSEPTSPMHGPAARIAALIDSMFSMESTEQADIAKMAVLSIEAAHPGALWNVARSHPHVESRAAASFLAVSLLLGDRKLVAQGVLDAVVHTKDLSR